MAIATCPKCATKLKVPDGTTASVRCPKCQTVFKTSAPPAAAPAPEFEVVDEPAPPPKAAPKPPPKAAVASAPAPAPAPKKESLDDEDDDRPRKKKGRNDDDEDDDRPRKKKSRNDDDEDDDRPRSKKRSRDDDDEEDDRPRKKKSRDDDDEDDDDRPRSKKRSRDDDDDEDDRPRSKKKSRDDDDDDDRPRKKKKSRDDDDDDRPRKSGGSTFGIARTGVLLLLISLGLYAGSMGLQLLFILIGLIGGVIPSGMGLVTGLMGLVNWIVGLVGLGLCIAGPSRARGLAIAALSVAVVHLVLSFITVNDSDSMPSNFSIPLLSGINRASNLNSMRRELSKEEAKNPGSARAKELRDDLKSLNDDFKDDDLGVGKSSRSKMRWADLTTFLTFSDKLIAILSYESKGFSKSLLGNFTGLAELARIILIALLLGSLAGAAKHYGAESKSKLGWIVAASAGGAALLVMLLAFVIADNIKPDTKDFAPKMPPQPNMSGKSFEQIQKEQEEYNRQVQAEFEKAQEKAESAGKAPIRWMAIGELLCLILHVGSIALPAMAALAIFSATKSGGGGGGGRSKKRSRRDDDDDD